MTNVFKSHPVAAWVAVSVAAVSGTIAGVKLVAKKRHDQFEKSGLSEKYSKVKEAVHDAAENTVETVKEKAADAAGTAKKVTTAVAEDVTEVVENATEAVKKTTKSTSSRAKKKAEDVKDKAEDVAEDVKDKAAAAKTKATAAAEEAKKQAEDAVAEADKKA